MNAVAAIATETPILESVFVAIADNATDIADIFLSGLPYWYGSPLSYLELSEWTAETR